MEVVPNDNFKFGGEKVKETCIADVLSHFIYYEIEIRQECLCFLKQSVKKYI